jgi:diguanylate cyclase (GGDEF)-like protein/PAS domain S-box-containing protein
MTQKGHGITNSNAGIEYPRKRPLRILFVEDDGADFELCVRVLKKAELEVLPDVVQTERDFVEKLQDAPYDIILADYQLPAWSGLDALKVMRERGVNIPFILVTGALGDDVAVDCIKQGVSDYVLKDRISRLPVAINRAIAEKQLVDERKLALNQLRESEENFRTLTETIASAVFIYRSGNCLYANRAAEIITGYSKDELSRLSAQDIIHPDFRDLAMQAGFGPFSEYVVPGEYELKILSSLGELRWLALTCSAIVVEGRHSQLITAFDVTERKRAEDKFRHLAARDPLTGLANYRRLLEAFDCERERSGRTGRSFALVLLDVDKLKKINDTYGHLIGSRVLRRVSNVLRSQCRSLDTASRYGGDEFAIVLPETGADAARHLAQRLAEKVRNDNERPNISASFGLAVCPEDGHTFKDVLSVADAELYLMKGQSLEDSRSSVKQEAPGADARITIVDAALPTRKKHGKRGQRILTLQGRYFTP